MILADQLDVLAVILAGQMGWSEPRIDRLLEAEALLVEGDTAAARTILEATANDPKRTSVGAWVALAHAYALDGDAEGAARIAAQTTSTSDATCTPWHHPSRLSGLLGGELAWPGQPGWRGR